MFSNLRACFKDENKILYALLDHVSYFLLYLFIILRPNSFIQTQIKPPLHCQAACLPHATIILHGVSQYVVSMITYILTHVGICALTDHAVNVAKRSTHRKLLFIMSDLLLYHYSHMHSNIIVVTCHDEVRKTTN